MKTVHPYARIKQALIDTRADSVAQRMFLISAMIHADERGERCSASMRTLAKYAGITRETGQRALRQFVACGEMVRASATFRGRARKSITIVVGYTPRVPEKCDLASQVGHDPTSQGDVISRHTHLKHPLRRKDKYKESASPTGNVMSFPGVKKSATPNLMNADQPSSTNADYEKKPPIPPLAAPPHWRPGFVKLWNAYPRKARFVPAQQAWDRLKADEATLERMLSFIAKAKNSQSWMNERGKYVPGLVKFLEEKRWYDSLRGPEVQAQVAL